MVYMENNVFNVKKIYLSTAALLLGALCVFGCASSPKSKTVSDGSGRSLTKQLAVLSDTVLSKVGSDKEARVAVFAYTVSELESVRGEFFTKQLTLALSKANKRKGSPVEVVSFPQLVSNIKKAGFSLFDLSDREKLVPLMKGADCDYCVVGNLSEKQFTFIVDSKVFNWKGEELLTYQNEVFRDDVLAEKVNVFGRTLEKLAYRLISSYKGFDTHRVAVYEFKENGIRSELGAQIARELPGYLSAQLEESPLAGQFEILTRSQLDQIVREQRITMGDLFKQDDKEFVKLLKATAIVSGDIARREGGVYITAQLIDSKTGTMLSSATVRYIEEAVGKDKPRDTVSDTALKSDRDPESGLPLEIISTIDGAVMVLVPGGLTFGRNITVNGESKKVEKEIKTFYIDKYEVTNELFCRFLNSEKTLRGSNGKTYIDLLAAGSRIYTINGVFRVRDGYEKHPVINVTWYGASAYAEWAGKKLPEYLQWQKAAGWDPVKRKLRKYPWGSSWDKKRANHGTGSAGDARDGYAGTCEVQLFENGASFYKVLNMSGNVWEWCSNIDRKMDVIDNFGTKVQKVIEKGLIAGGSFRKGGDSVTTTSVMFINPETINFSIGFRCVKNPE